MIRAPWALGALAAALVVGAAAEALANGAFPSAGQVLWDPSDPDRILLKTNYGLVTSADGGATWTWTCEEGLLVLGGEFHPQLARAPDGTIFGGLLDGMVRGRAGACAWERVVDLDGSTVVDVSQGTDGRAIAAVRREPGEPSEIWSSVDGARSWTRLSVLPIELDPFTLDAAPGDPDRLYVSGMLDKVPKVGGLATSADGGATWAVYPVPHSDPVHAPYIAAIDALDPEVVWVRLGGAPGEVLRSTNGGLQFVTVLRGEGFVRAFALSPDGEEVLAGGEVDGLLRANVADLTTWEPFLDVAARCASWVGDTIFVCGTQPADDFALWRFTEEDGLVPLYRQECLQGPEPCDAATPVGACAAEWPAQRAELGATGCAEGGGEPTGATGGVATPSSSDAASSGAASTGAGDGSGGAGAGAAPSGGCGCRVVPRADGAGATGWLALAVAALVAARRRQRGARSVPLGTRAAQPSELSGGPGWRRLARTGRMPSYLDPMVHRLTPMRARSCTMLALLFACGTRTPLSSERRGDARGDDVGGGGGPLDQLDPSCVPSPCIAPCTGQLLTASTVPFADVDIDVVATDDDAVLMAGNGLFVSESAGLLVRTTREGAVRWTASFEPGLGMPMALAPNGTGDVALCRAREWKAGRRATAIDVFDADGQLTSTVHSGASSTCDVHAREDELFVITSDGLSSEDGGALLQVAATTQGGSGRWFRSLPAAPLTAVVSSLSPEGELAVGYRAFGGSGVVSRVSVLRNDGTTAWQVDLRSNDQTPELTEVAFAPSGDLVVMGRVSGRWSIDFGGGTLAGSDHHLFLTRYGSDGAFRWARTFALPTENRFSGHAMTLDANGHTVIIGLTDSSRDLLGNPLEGRDGGIVFAEKLDDCGNHLWSSVVDTISDGAPRPFVGTDGAGRIVTVTTGISSTGSEVLFATLDP